MPARAPEQIKPVAVTAYTATTCAGVGRERLLDALQANRCALRPNDFTPEPLAGWIGRVDAIDDVALPSALAAWNCRNNRLAWLGLNADGFADATDAARERYGASRVAVLVGTSTSSIGETEHAYQHLAPGALLPAHLDPRVHTPHATGAFVQAALELTGPCLTVSTACSSSAKVFASAERLLRLGWVDAVVVGGVDSLCRSTLFGFHALQLVSPEPCQPFDANRRGISIGEAAGFALLERVDRASQPCLIGYGESSDAFHMSSPHPDGAGAERALDDALARSGVAAAAIDYLNLHGTASAKNDEVEAALVARRFPVSLHAGSTKGSTGHTLGAAGIVEAVVCLLALERAVLPGTANTVELDPACGPQVRLRSAERQVRTAMSNSFGFGGNNAVLVFSNAGGSA